jgi:hypothetical protein
MATTTGTAGSSLGAGGGTSMAGLADWASPYITDYLGKAQALSNAPYQTYQGPLTAGESGLQTQAFQGIGALTVPSYIGTAASTAGDVANIAGSMSYAPTSFSSGFQAPTAYTPTSFSGGFQAPEAYQSVGGTFDNTQAQAYMNPYLQQALDPQMKELQRQADIQRVADAGRLTQAGAFGGGRQAIMESEGRRNLLNKQSDVTGQGYATAYDKAMQQFNADQQRKVQETQFGAQQGMTAADFAARYGLDAAKAAEQSKQFGAQQGMTSADFAARYGADAAKAAEQSKQFGSTYGLDALRQQLSAAQVQGQLGQSQAEQQRANLAQQINAGAVQRGITSEGIAADLNEFNTQRDYPYKQVQFMRDMISGLPSGSVTNTPPQLSGIAQLFASAGGADKFLKDTGIGDLKTALSKLGLDFGGTT